MEEAATSPTSWGQGWARRRPAAPGKEGLASPFSDMQDGGPCAMAGRAASVHFPVTAARGPAHPSGSSSPLPTRGRPACEDWGLAWVWGLGLGMGGEAGTAGRTRGLCPKSTLILRPHPRSPRLLLRQQPLPRTRPRGHLAQASGAAAAVTPGPTLWEKVCTTPPGRTSNATVVGSDTASTGLSATAARSSAAHKLAPSPPFLLPLGAAILRSGPRRRTGRGEGHVGRPPEAT